MQKLIPLTKPSEMLAAGMPFETTDSARWAFRNRHETGLDGAFVRLGRRVFIDPDRFHDLVRRGQGVA